MRTGFRRRRQPRPRRRKAWIRVCLGKGGKFMIKLCETVTIFKTNLYHLLCLSSVSLLSPLSRVFLFLFSLFIFPLFWFFLSLVFQFCFHFLWIPISCSSATLTLELKMQPQRLRQHAMLQPSLYHHPALLTPPQVPLFHSFLLFSHL